ncbi:HNH endonuclease signature motif containing protein [Arthrobacter sp. ERGS1:01]|uniref:HNH endonuclease signature motif containing protein n=1 Tax=Arthrobacter sp. ERGS1:01 TaxID=1704044 RepID=UPI0006B4910F|nr:HNH endonuclease signature motif containing protein [Arthrobacter sp. ERGS1:01]
MAPERRPPISSADLGIDSPEALAEAEYLCAVSTLRSLALIESGLAALKARTVERLDAASTRLGVVAGLDPWQREILAISTTAELCAALTLPQRSGGELKRQSIALVRAHPDTLDALSAGSISWRNATVVLDHLETLEGIKGPSGEQAIPEESLRGFEHQLLELAPGTTTAKFLLQARRLRERTHPESLAARHAKAAADRKLVLLPDRDGMSWLSMFLPADSAQGIWNQASRTARTLQGPGEHRTLTQLRVDVLSEWLLETGSTQASDSGPGGQPRPRAQVLVTVPLLTLLGCSIEPAELEGYGPIPPRMARELAGGCPTVYRIMVDPCTNEYLSMDPKQYRVTGAVRALLHARDGTCSFPGCNTVTDDTELDHLLAWEDGGASVPENLSSECGVHHRLKHFKDRKARDGRRAVSKTRQGPDLARGPESKILDGWTPELNGSPGEKPAWISPAGYSCPPSAKASTPPLIPVSIAIGAIEELTEES